MKSTHALNFFLVGLSMYLGPTYWPDFLTAGATTSDASELWLLVMGITQMVLGLSAVGFNEVPRLINFFAAWEPVTMNFAPPDVSWVLPESFYAGLNEENDLSVALSLQQQLRMGHAA